MNSGHASKVVQAEGHNLEQRPRVRGHDLVGHGSADLHHLLGGGRLALAARVADLDLEWRNLIEDPLLSFLHDHGAQHLVPVDQAAERATQPFDVDVLAFDLHVGVDRHVSEVECARPPDPVGLLDVRERERQMTLRWRRLDLRKRHGARSHLVDSLDQVVGEAGDAEPFEQPRQREVDPECLPDPILQIDRHQGVEAELGQRLRHVEGIGSVDTQRVGYLLDDEPRQELVPPVRGGQPELP